MVLQVVFFQLKKLILLQNYFYLFLHRFTFQYRMLNQYSTPTSAASPSISTSSTTPPPPSLQQPPTSTSASSTSPSLPHNVSFIEFLVQFCVNFLLTFSVYFGMLQYFFQEPIAMIKSTFNFSQL